jgi:hypothetical protein
MTHPTPTATLTTIFDIKLTVPNNCYILFAHI